MTPERWRRITAIYHAVLDRNPEQRSAFLANACDGDLELRREIESLLEPPGAALIDQPVWNMWAAATSDTSRLTAGTKAARFLPGMAAARRYRIVALLGSGGMGEVYRAEDLTLGQTVALKFLPATSAGDERLVRRFREEVRLARRISHPNVCRTGPTTAPTRRQNGVSPMSFSPDRIFSGRSVLGYALCRLVH